MDNLRPPQYPLPVVVYTPSGLIRGVLQLPTVKNLRGFLNGDEEYLKLTEADFPGRQQVQQSFLLLRKDAVILVVPKEGHEPRRADNSKSLRGQRLVTCLLGGESVQGYLDIPRNLRTSDFLVRNRGFLELSACRISPNPSMGPQQADGSILPTVLVNAQCLVGVEDAQGPVAEEIQPDLDPVQAITWVERRRVVRT